jgi:hypothetical protein
MIGDVSELANSKMVINPYGRKKSPIAVELTDLQPSTFKFQSNFRTHLLSKGYALDMLDSPHSQYNIRV